MHLKVAGRPATGACPLAAMTDPPMRMPLVSRALFALVSLVLAVGAHAADYNATHIFNPNWPPHAKFHTGQTCAFAIALAVLTIHFAWRRSSDRKTLVGATAGFAAVYWVTQACAIFYPGTGFTDPDVNIPRVGGVVPVQIVIEIVCLAIICVAVHQAFKRDAKWVD